jgi:Rps23 Pro-64 3,4-dihydroxylase Tpa1-like proline 4-hydroxylase
MLLKVIKNFLKEEKAVQLANDIQDMPENWWLYALKSESDAVYFANSLRHIQNKSEACFKVDKDFSKSNSFCYKFKRTTDHYDSCPCFECELKKELEIKNCILYEMGWSSCTIQESFISAYGSGDYLSTHTDKGNGSVAFVLNLTQNWRPEFGGMLHVLNTDGSYTAIPPDFNSLILMEVDETNGTPHFVSEVSKYVTSNRIAYSGWYANDS